MTKAKRDETIPVEASFKEWRKDPEFMGEYEALEEAFATAELFISARGRNKRTPPIN
jgi:hypothetical protein